MDKSKTTNKIKCENAFSDDALKCMLTENIEEFFMRKKEYFKLGDIQCNLKISDENYFANVVLYYTQMNCYALINVKYGSISHHDIKEVNYKLKCIAMFEDNIIINSPFAVIIGISNNDVTIQYVTLGVKSDLFISKFHHCFPIMEELKRMISNTLNIH